MRKEQRNLGDYLYVTINVDPPQVRSADKNTILHKMGLYSNHLDDKYVIF